MADDVHMTRRSTGGDGGSILGGALVALVLGALLFWLPLIGPLAAGFFGGRIAGSPGRGLVAALLPAVVVALLVALLAEALPVIGPVLAVLIGGAVFLWAVAQLFFVVLGAILGGWYATQRGTRARTVVHG